VPESQYTNPTRLGEILTLISYPGLHALFVTNFHMVVIRELSKNLLLLRGSWLDWYCEVGHPEPPCE
jgi:hypothetical protein